MASENRGFGVPAVRTVRYQIVDIGTLGGESTEASAVNDVGQVAGDGLTASWGNHAYLYTKNQMLDLGDNGALGSTGDAINAQGVVAGKIYRNKPYGPSQAFVCRGGKMTILGGLTICSVTRASGINRAGQIVGASGGFWWSSSVAVLWTDFGRNIHRLPSYPEGGNTMATAINDAGDVIGHAELDKGSRGRSFLLADGKMTDLGTLGGAYCYAAALNYRRQIVGYASARGKTEVAFLWDRGVMKPLDFLPDDGSNSQSMAYGIDDSGAAVGRTGGFYGGGEPTRAVLWRNGLAYDLNKLISANSCWTLLIATAISARGNIVGNGLYKGQKRAFLLVPL